MIYAEENTEYRLCATAFAQLNYFLPITFEYFLWMSFWSKTFRIDKLKELDKMCISIQNVLKTAWDEGGTRISRKFARETHFECVSVD